MQPLFNKIQSDSQYQATHAQLQATAEIQQFIATSGCSRPTK